MAKAMELKVTESLTELKKKQRQAALHLVKRIQMLILIKEGKQQTKRGLADALGVSSNTIQTWRKAYKTGGLAILLADERGGKKVAQITPAMHKQIEKRLNNPQEGFKGFKDAQQWINKTFGLSMEYQATHKYLTRKFGAKLKVPRKSHIHQDPAAIAVFKKPIREAIIYKK
jgi:transposase